MKYREIADGIFVDRPNRFIAHVGVNGAVETVHVKNTGRCKELLLPGTAVRLEVSDNPKRKTKYDLVAVHKQGLGWVNMDSQAPNKVVGEWLAKQGYDYIKPEFTYGKSRIDFYMEKGEQKYLLEVKGCTLEVDGIGYFPDAPTERGVKHLHELAQAQRKGYQCAVAFVIQMEGITEEMCIRDRFGTVLRDESSQCRVSNVVGSVEYSVQKSICAQEPCVLCKLSQIGRDGENCHQRNGTVSYTHLFFVFKSGCSFY